MVLVATIAWSFAGVFTRMLSLDLWATIALRSLAGGAFLFVPMLVQRRTAAFRDLVAIGLVGWMAVFLGVVAQAATAASFWLTSVAHVTVIYATSPFIAALIAWIWLREAISRATLVATIISMTGVFLVVSASGDGASNLAGDIVALIMTAAFATIIVLSKANPNLPMMKVTILSAFLTFLLFFPLANLDAIDLRNLVIVSVYGFTNLVFAFYLFLLGSRHIPAASSGLIITLEIALAPLWVWLLFNETIDHTTLLGGVLVAVAVIGYLVLSAVRRARPLPAPAPG